MRMRDLMKITEATDHVLDFDPRKYATLFDLDRAAALGGADPKAVKAFRVALSGDNTIRLYHGTSVKHDVWDKGLLPTSATRRRSIQSGSGFVYLTYDPMRALTFAQMGYPREGPYVVYSVELPVRMLLADPDQLRNKRQWTGRDDIGTGLIDSLIHGGAVRVKGRVDTYRIKVYGYFDQHSNQIEKPDGHNWGDDQYR